MIIKQATGRIVKVSVNRKLYLLLPRITIEGFASSEESRLNSASSKSLSSNPIPTRENIPSNN